MICVVLDVFHVYSHKKPGKAGNDHLLNLHGPATILTLVFWTPEQQQRSCCFKPCILWSLFAALGNRQSNHASPERFKFYI